MVILLASFFHILLPLPSFIINFIINFREVLYESSAAAEDSYKRDI